MYSIHCVSLMLVYWSDNGWKLECVYAKLRYGKAG